MLPPSAYTTLTSDDCNAGSSSESCEECDGEHRIARSAFHGSRFCASFQLALSASHHESTYSTISTNKHSMLSSE